MKRIIDKLVLLAKEKVYVIKIILLLVASSILFIGYLFLETNEGATYQTEQINADKKEYLKQAIAEISKQAKADAAMKVDVINKEINLAYPVGSASSKELLEADVLKYVNGDLEETPLALIMYRNTKGKYFNINNDNNDPFVVAVKREYIKGEWIPVIYITSDYSLNCLTPDPRTIEEEINGRQFAKSLVRDAIEGIVLDNKEMTIWHFVEVPKNLPYHDVVETLDYIDVDSLIKFIDEYGYDSINGFEFLQAVRMNETTDIARRSIYKGGSQLNTDAIILYYFNNFNFGDHLTIRKDIDSQLKDYDEQAINIIRQANGKKRIYILFLILDTFLVLMSTYALDKRQP